ncbi:hypothetical protein [Oceanisphaera sp.]
MKIPIMLVILLLLGGCSGTPVHYHSEREIPTGPGLLTGTDGAFLHQR